MQLPSLEALLQQLPKPTLAPAAGTSASTVQVLLALRAIILLASLDKLMLYLPVVVVVAFLLAFRDKVQLLVVHLQAAAFMVELHHSVGGRYLSPMSVDLGTSNPGGTPSPHRSLSPSMFRGLPQFNTLGNQSGSSSFNSWLLSESMQ